MGRTYRSCLTQEETYGRYFLTYLQENFTGSELEKIMQELPSIKDWYIQAGSVSMGATGGSERAFMLGSGGAANNDNYNLARRAA